ncbi:hypothetical protein GQ457_05G026550 [Hibiscus cannabinus]
MTGLWAYSNSTCIYIYIYIYLKPFGEEVHKEEEHVAQEEENHEKQNQDAEEEQNNTIAEEEDIIVEEEESADVAEEEYGAEEEDIVVEEEESATEEEEDYAVEKEESTAESFDVSDNEYDCGIDEGCKQKDGIGIRVKRNMDGFGPNSVHVNDKDHGPESEIDKSKELHSEHGSDSDGPRYPEFKSDIDMVKPKFVKGLVFPNMIELKQAIKQYGMVDWVEVKLKRNGNRRLQAICKEGCPWKLRATPMNPKDSKNQTWQIKTMVNCHTCSKSVSNSNMTSKWMANYYIGKFTSEPNYTLRSLRHDVLHEFGTLVSPRKRGRARDHALEMIEGNHKAQYGRIYDYLQELRSTNPGTTTICYLDLRLFQRMHVCLKEVIEDIFPYAKDRKCVRHMYKNFKEKHKGQALTDVVRKAVRATYLREFENAMDQLKSLSDAAYIWIEGENPAQWSRSHFSTRSKCDMLLNNHCESFNKSILEAIDKPILTLMETIRGKIMTRIVSKREAVEKYKGLLCGKNQKKLDAGIEESIRFWPTYTGVNTHQVEAGPSQQHVVDLDQRSCTCRKWDLTRIPCGHAASVFRLNNLKPEDYVNECYHNITQLAIYSNMIKPIKGPNQWDLVTNMEPILPPIIRRPP